MNDWQVNQSRTQRRGTSDFKENCPMQEAVNTSLTLEQLLDNSDNNRGRGSDKYTNIINAYNMKLIKNEWTINK